MTHNKDKNCLNYQHTKVGQLFCMWMYLKIESSFYPFKHILTIYSSICWCGWTKPCQGAPVARKSCAFAKWRAMTAWDPGNQLEPIAKHVTVGRLGLAMSQSRMKMNKHASLFTSQATTETWATHPGFVWIMDCARKIHKPLALGIFFEACIVFLGSIGLRDTVLEKWWNVEMSFRDPCLSMISPAKIRVWWVWSGHWIPNHGTGLVYPWDVFQNHPLPCTLSLFGLVLALPRGLLGCMVRYGEIWLSNASRHRFLEPVVCHDPTELGVRRGSMATRSRIWEELELIVRRIMRPWRCSWKHRPPTRTNKKHVDGKSPVASYSTGSMTVDVWETELINIDREILYTYHEELKIQIRL